jgi:exodeoxyribonuclease VII small subunit
MAVKTPKPQTLPFERALERLEAIVEQLESGSVALADAVKLFEEGIVLRKRCLELLKEAEQKIKFLTPTDSGELIAAEPPEDWEETEHDDVD